LSSNFFDINIAILILK
jgi:hypothetical protein